MIMKIADRYNRYKKLKQLTKLRKFAHENMGKKCSFNLWDQGFIVGYNYKLNAVILGVAYPAPGSWELLSSDDAVICNNTCRYYVNLKFEHAQCQDFG